MVVDATGIGILAEGRLGDDRGAMVQHLGDEIDSLGGTVGYHDRLRREPQLQRNEFFQGTRAWLRIVFYHIQMSRQMLLQCRMVGMWIDIGTEVHSNHVRIIAVEIVSVSFNHGLLRVW